MYRNENHVGPAIESWLQSSNSSRADLFITSKVTNPCKEPAKLRKALLQTLEDLRTPYLDLYLIHSPFDNPVPIKETWDEMQKLQKEGLVKSIGVSNFAVEHLRELTENSSVFPALNQVEYSAYLQQPELVEYCNKNNITLSSYAGLSPMLNFKGGPLDSILSELSEKYKVSPMQILQTWIRSRGIVVITTTGKESRMKEILDGLNLSIDNEDLDRISKAGESFTLRQFWTDNFTDVTPCTWKNE